MYDAKLADKIWEAPSNDIRWPARPQGWQYQVASHDLRWSMAPESPLKGQALINQGLPILGTYHLILWPKLAFIPT